MRFRDKGGTPKAGWQLYARKEKDYGNGYGV